MCMKICSNCLKRALCDIPGDDHIDCELWVEDHTISEYSNHGFNINISIPIQHEPPRSNRDK